MGSNFVGRAVRGMRTMGARSVFRPSDVVLSGFFWLAVTLVSSVWLLDLPELASVGARVGFSVAALAICGGLGVWSHRVYRRRILHREPWTSSQPAGLQTLSRDFEVLDMNAAGLEMFEVDGPEAILGQDVRDFLHPEDTGAFVLFHEAVLGGRSHHARFRIIGRRGTPRWIEIHASPMRSAAGEVCAHVAVTLDVTEPVRLERSLREANARLEVVIDTVVNGVVLFDAEGRVVRVNPACALTLGYPKDAMIGMAVQDLLHDSDGGAAALEAFVAAGSGEVEGVRADGSRFPMLLSMGVTAQESGRIFVGIFHDLSAQKRAQQHLTEAHELEAVGQLSGGIAHDFNNLLTIVVGSAGILLEALPENSEAWDLAQMISLAGARGAEQTQRLLAFGRRQMLQPETLQCDVLIRSLDSLLRGALEEDIEIVLALDPDLLAVSVDPGQLEAALVNLALNARDAMPDGGRLLISATNLPVGAQAMVGSPDGAETLGSDRYVMIEVSDGGIGMEPEVRARAFEPFFTTKDVGEGTGLGLSMVYGFAKQSQGHVTLVSEPGLGTSVRLYLPALESAPRQDMQVFDVPPTDPSVGTGHTVMVVEDDPLVRAYMVNCLQSLGYRVVSCSNGREALSLIVSGQPLDLVVADTVMPGGISGVELADQTAGLRPKLPILLTSGYAVESLAAKGRYRPSTPFLPKPFSRDTLGSAVSQLLGISVTRQDPTTPNSEPLL